MSLRVARGTFNPEKGRFHFYVAFKPTLDPTAEQRGVEVSFPIDVAVSVTETGELADLAFALPKPCSTNKDSLMFLQRTDSASVIEERVFVTVPGPEWRFDLRSLSQPRTRRCRKNHWRRNQLSN